MEFIANAITNKQFLTELSTRCFPQVANFPPLEYFSEYICDPNNHSIHFKFENKYELVIIGEKIENHFLSTSRAFVSPLYVSSLDFPLQEFEECVLDYFSSRGIQQVRLRAIPAYISTPIKLFSKSRLSYRATTSIVDLSKFSLSKRRIRSIEKARAAHFVFELCDDVANDEVWKFLETFLKSRKLPSLDFSRVGFLTANYPEVYFLACVRNTKNVIIAAAFINISGEALRIPNYFGLREYEGSTDFLLWNIIQIATSRNLKYVDLGISSDPSNGVDVVGIVNFKAEFSAQRFDLFEEVIDL
jgi:hypothetical protein